MSSLPQKVASNIRDRDLLPQGQGVLVAVSGGIDSMVLLSVLCGLSRQFRWKLTVAHLNHQLRGRSSDADERLVVRAAKALNVPCVAVRADVRTAANRGRVSIEMAGRKLRHEFLARVASERGIRRIALAHHFDDQTELFFVRLLRGSGTQALAGMKWANPSPSNPAITLVRPLKDCSKQALREYAAQEGVRFREDSSNASLDILRNRIRHELLPLLRHRYQSGVDKNIAKVMDILREESFLVMRVAEDWLEREGLLEKCPKTPSGSAEASGSGFSTADLRNVAFEALPVAVQRCCVRRQLAILGIVAEFDLIEHLRQFQAKSIEVSRPSLPADKAAAVPRMQRKNRHNGLLLERQGGRVVCREASQPSGFDPGRIELDLRKDGDHEWCGVRLAWRLEQKKGAKLPSREAGAEVFDAQKVGDRVQLRHWRPGDRFQPIGMSGTVKIQDLFVNLKVPASARGKLLVAATSRGEVFWVEGLRISERFKLTKQSIRRLHWRWQRL